MKRPNSFGFSGTALKPRLNHKLEPRQPQDVEPSQRPKFRLSRVFWAGLILLILGTGPLTTIILLARFGVTKDPNPNPIGFGILTFLTFWPSIILMIVGGVTSYRRYKSGSQMEAVRQFEE